MTNVDRRAARRRWLDVHLYIGLLFGPLIVLVGMTGSAIVFDHRIDEFLNPDLLTTRGSGPMRSVDEILASARAAVADATDGAFIIAPRRPGAVFLVKLNSSSWGGTVEVAVDPYTARVRGTRLADSHLMAVVYDLHFRLLSGNVGWTIVGVSGVLLLASTISGLYVWWPRSRRWSAAFAFKPNASRIRRYFDLHKLAGVYGSMVLAMVAFSGVYMTFPGFFEPVLSVFSPITLRFPDQLRSAPSQSSRPLDISQAINIANTIFPAAELKFISLPGTKDGVVTVAKRQPSEVRETGGTSRVFLDRYSGEVLLMHDPRRATAADAFIAWQFPLHNGEAFGLFGRWIVFISGLIPLLLYVTGLLLWWRRRAARKIADRMRAGHIRHAGKPYTLRQTSNGKLILTK